MKAIRTTIKYGALMAVIVRVLSSTAGASSIPVANFSFENPALSPGAENNDFIPGWTSNGGGVINAPGTYLASVPDGSQAAWMWFGSTLSQDLGVATVAGQTYTMHVYVGVEHNFVGPHYELELLDGATVIGDVSGQLAVNDPFTLISVSGVAGGAGDISVKLISFGEKVLFDDVTVETSGWALVGYGIAVSVVSEPRTEFYPHTSTLCAPTTTGRESTRPLSRRTCARRRLSRLGPIIQALPRGARPRYSSRRVRGHRPDRRGWNGRGLPRPRHAA
jgi:hypothetical protein